MLAEVVNLVAEVPKPLSRSLSGIRATVTVSKASQDKQRAPTYQHRVTHAQDRKLVKIESPPSSQ